MAFWFFMLSMDLLIPAAMIVVGKRFRRKPPEEINVLFGYRSARSMRNEETWRFAHSYFGRLWNLCGWILLPISAIPLLFVIGERAETVGFLGGAVCIAQLVLLAGTVVLTERALKRRFDGE